MLAAPLLAVCLTAAPTPTPATRLATALAAVSLKPDDYGPRIYRGLAYPLAGPRTAPRFIYERHTVATDAGVRSSSVTFEGEQVVLIDVAQHDADYQLERFTEYQFQVGEVRTLVLHDGVAEFRRLDREGEKVSRERTTSLPIVAAPTFYGFVQRQWARLLAGTVVPFRYAVLDRLETIGFELVRLAAPPGQVRLQMRASNAVVALLVDPIVVTYGDDGQLVSYDGQVPMKTGGKGAWRDFVAHVEYADLVRPFR